jgi:hypothetical protein
MNAERTITTAHDVWCSIRRTRFDLNDFERLQKIFLQKKIMKDYELAGGMILRQKTPRYRPIDAYPALAREIGLLLKNDNKKEVYKLLLMLEEYSKYTPRSVHAPPELRLRDSTDSSVIELIDLTLEKEVVDLNDEAEICILPLELSVKKQCVIELVTDLGNSQRESKRPLIGSKDSVRTDEIGSNRKRTKLFDVDTDMSINLSSNLEVEGTNIIEWGASDAYGCGKKTANDNPQTRAGVATGDYADECAIREKLNTKEIIVIDDDDSVGNTMRL